MSETEEAAGAADATHHHLEWMADSTQTPRPCPVAASLQVLGERWTLLAIREMNYGVHRFEQITKFTGASRDILADRLRKLESAGVVERRQYSEHPPRFEYHLTTAGEEARPVLVALAQWGTRWAQDPAHPTRTFIHDCGHSLDIEQNCRHCGRTVGRASMRVLSMEGETVKAAEEPGPDRPAGSGAAPARG